MAGRGRAVINRVVCSGMSMLLCVVVRLFVRSRCRFVGGGWLAGRLASCFCLPVLTCVAYVGAVAWPFVDVAAGVVVVGLLLVCRWPVSKGEAASPSAGKLI